MGTINFGHGGSEQLLGYFPPLPPTEESTGEGLQITISTTHSTKQVNQQVMGVEVIYSTEIQIRTSKILRITAVRNISLCLTLNFLLSLI